jgi:hypothetical protein
MPHELNLPADSHTKCGVLLKRYQPLVKQRIWNIKDAEAVLKPFARRAVHEGRGSGDLTSVRVAV